MQDLTDDFVWLTVLFWLASYITLKTLSHIN